MYRSGRTVRRALSRAAGRGVRVAAVSASPSSAENMTSYAWRGSPQRMLVLFAPDTRHQALGQTLGALDLRRCDVGGQRIDIHRDRVAG